jgi:GNAT superfamily N-acetyltransferase
MISPEQRVRTRRLTASDIGSWIPLLQAYMREAYGVEWTGSSEALRRDALGQRCSVLLATTPHGAAVGFVAWCPSYDLHNCVAGVDVLDLYVVPAMRSRGVALLLACALAAEEHGRGAVYMKGMSLEGGSGRRLYGRFAVCDPGGCIVSGRAFRRLAELAGRPVREIARSLPERAWNYEA